MPMDYAFILDPLPALKAYKDSSVAMMRALQMRTLHLALRFTLIALASLLPYLREALAETLGDARVGFSAERVLIIDGQSYVGRMWHMPGEQRHEQDLPALRPVFILRAGSAVGDVILPALHTVVEYRNRAIEIGLGQGSVTRL